MVISAMGKNSIEFSRIEVVVLLLLLLLPGSQGS